MERSIQSRTHYCGMLRKEHIGQEVAICGWVAKSRDLGSIVFADIRDREGICQIVADQRISQEVYEKASGLGSEYVVRAQGKVKERSSKNPHLPTGDIEIEITDLTVLSTSKTPPIYVKDEDDAAEALRLKYRYLDLRKPKMQKNLKMRHQVMQIIRRHLSEQGFLEIETPILTKPTPEGARDYLVPSRLNRGNFYALPQSPQLFKQLLMVSGMDRYFQIVRCFRDEDLRADRQPEFTQVDCEMSFVETEEVLRLMETMIAQIFQEVLGVNVSLPLKRMPYAQAMKQYGSDKPDLRFDLPICEVSDICAGCGFLAFESAHQSQGQSVQALLVPSRSEELSRRAISALEEVAKTYGAKGLAWVKWTAQGISSPLAKFFQEDFQEALTKKLDAKEGDIAFFVADKDKIALEALGQVRLALGKKLSLYDPNSYAFLYVTEFPLFEYSDLENRFMAMHHPFTAPIEQDLPWLEKDPSKVRSHAYDMVLNGIELGGGSLRIHDPLLQEKMFEALGFSKEQAWAQFGFLLEAFSYGTPPHGGIAFGLDRLLMLMTQSESIREVMAFPKNQNAVCPLTQAPAKADESALKELGIDVSKE